MRCGTGKWETKCNNNAAFFENAGMENMKRKYRGEKSGIGNNGLLM